MHLNRRLWPFTALNSALTQFWCSVYGSLNSGSGSRRARSNSIPARPYICRFSILSRFMCPSTGPLLHGLLTADSTADRCAPADPRAQFFPSGVDQGNFVFDLHPCHLHCFLCVLLASQQIVLLLLW